MTDEEYELLTEKQRQLIHDVVRLESMVVSLNTAVIVLQDQYTHLIPMLNELSENVNTVGAVLQKHGDDTDWSKPVVDLQQRQGIGVSIQAG